MARTAAIRVVGYGTHFGGFIDSVGPFSKKNVNDGDRYGTRVSILWEPTPDLKITPRVVYQDVKANGFPREEVYNLYDNQFTTQNDLGKGKRLQYLKMPEEFHDKTLLADLVASYDFGGVELTSVSSYLHRNILVSRDASALTGSVYISFAGAAPAAAGGAALISNLRDTTKLNQFTQELRLASTGAGPFQWVFGGFYSHANRKYAQRLPTPGADVFSQDFLDVVAPGTPVSATYNGFPADSPYNADLPYVDKQTACSARRATSSASSSSPPAAAGTTSMKPATSFRAAYSRTRIRGSATRRSRTASARAGSSAGNRTGTSA